MQKENTALDLCGSSIKNLLNNSIRILTGKKDFYDIPDSNAGINFTYKDKNYKLTMECVDEGYNMLETDPLLIARDEDYYNIVMDYVDTLMDLFQVAYKFILNNLSNDVIIELQPYLHPVEMNYCHNLRLINHDGYKIIAFIVREKNDMTI